MKPKHNNLRLQAEPKANTLLIHYKVEGSIVRKLCE